jgi:hypothetical protein
MAHWGQKNVNGWLDFAGKKIEANAYTKTRETSETSFGGKVDLWAGRSNTSGPFLFPKLAIVSR